MKLAPLLFFVFAACGARTETTAPPAAPEAPKPVQQAIVVAEDDYVPAEAHALGEAVVDEEFNRNKTTRLQMSITTLVGRTSELSGISTSVAARQENLDDRLTRLAAKVTETEIVIQLPGSILFDFDSAAIRPDAERALEDVRQVIASYPGRPVRIEGHTDSIASEEYNRALSERRAVSVAQWLKERGVETPSLTTAGLGESKPAASNETSEGRQKNRRVEIVIARK